MRLAFACVLSCLGLATFGQWDVPVRIEMNGDLPEDRQILGLDDPNAADAAVSFAAARATTMAYANATGTLALIAELDPVPAAYTPGMAVTIVPASVNEANATLDLNGLGPVPIVKWGSVPLDSADLMANVPVRLIYDGSQFQLISSNFLSCPTGYHPVGLKYCVQPTNAGSGNFFEAIEYCRNMNARLCTFAEWVEACRTDPAFVGTVQEGEWIDHAANNLSDAKKVGYGSIGSGDGDLENVPSCVHGTTAVPTNIGGIRCCRNR